MDPLVASEFDRALDGPITVDITTTGRVRYRGQAPVDALIESAGTVEIRLPSSTAAD